MNQSITISVPRNKSRTTIQLKQNNRGYQTISVRTYLRFKMIVDIPLVIKSIASFTVILSATNLFHWHFEFFEFRSVST